MVIRVSAVLGIALIGAAIPLASQNAPLATVPATLPAQIQDELQGERAVIAQRISSHNAKVRDFLPRCGPGTIRPDDTDKIAACGREHQGLMNADKELQDEKRAFAARVNAAVVAPCAAIESRLDRERRTMALLMRTMQLTSGELKDWVHAADEAQAEAVMTGVSLLTLGAAKELQARGEAARRIYVSDVPQILRQVRPGVDTTAIERELFATVLRYKEAERAANVGIRGEKSLGAIKLFKLVAGQAQGIYALQQKGDLSLRQILQDPVFQSNASDAVRFAADRLSKTSALAKITPLYPLGAFGADYIRHGLSWAVAAIQVGHQNAALGSEAQATKAIQNQIARTTQELQACKASH